MFVFAVSALVVSILVTSSAPAQADTENSNSDSTYGDYRKDVAPFIKRYCMHCHGPQKAEADLALHHLSGDPLRKSEIDIWNKVIAKLEDGEMPPEKAQQPPPNELQKVLQWIKGALKNVGETSNDAKWLHPSRGNWVDHDALFSGKEAPQSATPARLWRLTGQAYETFIQSKNDQFKLGIKNYGEHRIRSPWELSRQREFSDYASSHRIGEAEIEFHLRTATRVARAMVQKFSGHNGSFGEWIKELNVLLKAGKSAKPAQMKAATKAAFERILGRPPSQEELERYTGFLANNLKTLNSEKAVEQFLIAILFQPDVMYRVELPPEGGPRELMAPRTLARAIAFALSDQEPDEILRKAAADGMLTQREDVRVQVVRLLSDRSIAKPRILRFFQEYFGYPAAIGVFKDETTRKAAGLRGYNGWHPDFFVSDTNRLIESILADDKNVLYELLTTSKTFAVTGETQQAQEAKRYPAKPFNTFAQTALEIYELPIKRDDWSDDRPFQMPHQHRMGILTHPSWLIAQSTNFDNHAIHRGRWIRERLLGGWIPEIPVTIEAALPDEPHRTLRERMRVTRVEYCWNCHQLMDPLGLPFENYDHFGRFRTTELKKPVDTTGNVEWSGEPQLDGPVNNPQELIRKLASSERVQQVFVRHVFRYFLGRNETLQDGPALVEAHRSYVASDGSMNALITAILTSDAFLYRTTPTNP